MATASTIDYAHLLRDLPSGAWVAISEDGKRIIAYAAELQPVIEKSRQVGVADPIIVRVPEQAVSLIL